MKTATGELMESWRSRGRRIDVYGQEIFVVDAESTRRDAPTLVVLHGFPTSSLDFHHNLDALTSAYRVVLHDHLGFGFSDKPADASYSLIEQAEIALAVWDALGVRRAHLLAHDYGTSVATEILARRERGGIGLELESVTLCNGSVHIELADLRLSQRLLRSPVAPLFARLLTRGYFKNVMRRLWGDPSRAEDADLDAMWEAILERGGRDRSPELSRYIDERFRFHRRWIGALERLDLPTHVLWGRRDPVAVPAIAEQLAREIRGAKATWLDDLGHYPMMEAPERWQAAVLDFLQTIDGIGGD